MCSVDMNHHQFSNSLRGCGQVKQSGEIELILATMNIQDRKKIHDLLNVT